MKCVSLSLALIVSGAAAFRDGFLFTELESAQLTTLLADCKVRDESPAKSSPPVSFTLINTHDYPTNLFYFNQFPPCFV